MEWLDRPFGPMRIRAWGLIANMLSNAVALYGLSLYLGNGSGLGILVAGGLASLALIAVIAVPVK